MVVDYYSCYIELVELRYETTEDIICMLKSIFARHGIPMIVFSDNGPCYKSAQFASFAMSYGFQHHTSSPKYAQSNGMAERTVQTAKSLLKKATDPYLALLSYRSTPLNYGYSPAQILMCRQIRSTVPVTKASLRPQIPDAYKLQQLDHNCKDRQASYFNKRHRTREKERWRTNDHVWVPDLRSNATIIEILPHRSYKLRTQASNIIRCNGRLLLTPLSPQSPSSLTPSTPRAWSTANASTPSQSSSSMRCRLRDINQPAARARLHRCQPAEHYVTRSGCSVRSPDRLNSI